MTLETEDGPLVENPSVDEIRAALEGLGDGFAILPRSDSGYAQVTRGESGGFLIERQEGDPARHYQTRDKSLALSAVVHAFERFARGDSSWVDELEWERLTW